MAEAKRIEIGFSGGQVVPLRLAAKELTALQSALSAGEGWYEIAGEEGALSVEVTRVAFVRVEGDEQSIGFAGS